MRVKVLKGWRVQSDKNPRENIGDKSKKQIILDSLIKVQT